MNNEMNFPPNFERLVLGCIDADFCKQILNGKLLTRSTRFTFMRLLEKRTEVENEVLQCFTYFCTAQISKFLPKTVSIFRE